MNVLESVWFTQISQLKELSQISQEDLQFVKSLECKLIIDLEILRIEEIEKLSNLVIKYLE